MNCAAPTKKEPNPKEPDKTTNVFRVLERAKREKNRGRIVIYLDGTGVITEFEFLRKF